MNLPYVANVEHLLVLLAKCLHKQEFASLLINAPPNIIQACLHSCVGPGANTWLLTCLTTRAFTLSPLPYNTMYPSWLTTSYGCPSFTMLMWSNHWRSKYPFASMPLWELKYNSPWYTLRYCHSYCFGKWNTCSEGGLPPFPSSHSTMNGYPYHKRRLPNLDERHHYWPNSHRYGVTRIDNDNTCNDVGCSRRHNHTLNEH